MVACNSTSYLQMHVSRYAVEHISHNRRRNKQFLGVLNGNIYIYFFSKSQPICSVSDNSQTGKLLNQCKHQKKRQFCMQPWLLVIGRKHLPVGNSNHWCWQEQSHGPGWTLLPLQLLSKFTINISHTNQSLSTIQTTSDPHSSHLSQKSYSLVN